MPVIPFNSSSRVAQQAVEQWEEDEARRYRETSDAKLDELRKQGVKKFDPNGGEPMINIPEPLPPGGWRLNPPGVETPNPWLESGTPDMSNYVPAEGDPLFPQFEQDRLRKAAPQELASWQGGNSPNGVGGPEQEVSGLSSQDIADLKAWREKRDQDQSDLKMRETMGRVDRSPDEVAKAVELADKTGANRLEVQENLKGFQQSDAMSRIEALRQSAPKVRSWLDDPVNLEVAHDDTENLSFWEQAERFLSPGSYTFDEQLKSIQVGFGEQLQESFWGIDRMLAEANASIYKALPDWVPGKFDLANQQVQRALYAQMQSKAYRDQVAANMPVGDTWIERGLYGAGASAPSTIVSLAVTAITKSPVIGGGTMGATTAGDAYGDARDEGKSLGDSFRYALTQGGIETATEFIPLKFLVGDLAKDTPFAKTFFKQAAAEGISEQAATFLQDASTWLELNPDKTLGEFLAERPNAALETLVASTVMSGVQTTVGVGIQKAADGASQTMQQRRAEQLATTFDAMAQNAKDSKLATRLPEKYRDLVNQVTKDGPLESVRVAPEGITALAQEQGLSTEQVAQAFRIDPNEIVTAMEAGEDVVIPAGNYAAALSGAKKDIGVSGETIHGALAPHMRLRADDFTAKEREAMQAVFEAEQEARTKAQGEQQGFADAADRVRESIREQVAGAGVFNTDAANTQAELVGSMVTTLAERTGMDPESLWKEQGFDIIASLNGEEQVDAVALAQTVMDELASPVGFITGKDGAGNRLKFTPRDIVLGYNDGDKALDMALDLELREDINQQDRIKNLVYHTRLSVRRAAELGQLERLAEKWGVTPDELEKFGAPTKPGRKAGAFADLMADVVDIVERDNRNGAAPGLEQVVERLAARGRTISAATLKVRLSNARNGSGDGVLSDEMRERVRGLQFARGRGAAQGKSLAQSRLPDPPSDEEMTAAANALFPLEFEAWKAGREGLSNPEIAERINAARPEATMAVEDVGVHLSRARAKGFDVAKSPTRVLGARTMRVIELRRQGRSYRQIAELLYPELDVETAISRAKVAYSKYKDTLAQDARGTFTPREDRSVIRLFESANLSTLAHEGAHWYLDTLWRMSKTENPHPFVLQQLAAIREWAGKHPEWDAMFTPDGRFTPEGVDIQEMFAESFEAYLMEGKAPTTALRSVFASFKQWLLNIYKGIKASIGGRVRLNDEIREVFDRMLATDEAIKAVHTGMARDGEAMAVALMEKQDPKGLWTPERKEKFLTRMRERYAAARERAEAALMARLMDEYQRSQKSWWNDEERQTRREVQSEVDERPEQRAYAWLSGVGWRDTREAQAEVAATEAEAMAALQQAEAEGLIETNATDDTLKVLQLRAIEGGLGPLILMFRTTSGRIIAFPGDGGQIHHDLARTMFGLGDLKLDHGMYNPRRWPTIAAMNADTTNAAWYATTGTQQDQPARELAQKRYSNAEHREKVRQAYDFLRENPEYVNGPLSKIMEAADVSAFAADRARRLYRRGGELAQRTVGPTIVYRGSAEDEEGVTENGRLGLGLYSAEDPEIGGEWGGQTGKVDAWIVNGPLFDLDAETAEGLENYEKQEDTPAAKKLFARLKAEGYVGVRDPWSGHINVFVDGAMERYPAGDKELGSTWTNDEEVSLAQPVQPSRQLDAMGFYSALREAVRNSPQNKASAEQWKATLSKLPGVKAEEIEWTGVNDWLDAQEGPVTREALVGYLAASGVKVEEVQLSKLEMNQGTRYSGVFWAIKNATNREDAVMILANEGRAYDWLKRYTPDIIDDNEDWAENVVDDLLAGTPSEGKEVFATTQWEQHTLPGGDNYKELLLTLPAVKGPTTHWDEPNVVAHARFKERKGPNGEKVLALEEIQSDWHQKGRKEGYEQPVDPERAKATRAERDAASADLVNARKALVDWFTELEKDDLGDVIDEAFGLVSPERRADIIETIYATADLRGLSESLAERLTGRVPDILLHFYETVDFYGDKPGLAPLLKAYTDAKLRGNEANQAYMNANYPGGIPRAPFANNGWVNLVLKRMIRYAAENNFDTLAWIPGSVQNGNEVETDDNRSDFYDKIVPNAANRLGRKYGAEVILAKAPEMAGSTNTGRYAAVEDDAGNGWLVVDTTRNNRVMSRHDTEEEASTEARGSNRTKGTPGVQWHALPITPQLKAAAMEGMPLFQTAPKKGTTTPPANLPPMRLNLQAVREQYGEQALAEIPPEVAAFSMQATDLEQFVDLARSVRKTLNTKRPKSLWKFISTPRRIGSGNDAISYRGIRDNGGELIQMVGEKKAAPGLIADKEQDGKRARSYTLEGAAHAAWEEGYFQGQNPPDPDTFLAALGDDFAGRAPRYATRDLPDLQAIENAEQWAEWFDANEVDIRADVATLREKLAVIITSTSDNAIGPDEAAPFFKMRDGMELLKALKQGPLRSKLIREETRRRMIERHGDIFRDGTLMQEAEAYARNEVQHRQFEIELEALAEAAGQPAAANLAKQQAIENLRSKQVREVLNYNQWLILERRWAKKALEAAEKGDSAKAAEYARYRLVNSHMFTEGRKLADKVEKTVTHLRGFEAKTKLARLHAAGKDYATQMSGLLSDYQFRNESRKAEDRRASRALWLQTQMQGIDPFAAYADPTKTAQEQQAAAAEAIERSAVLGRLAEGVEARNYKSITVEELLAVRDEADLIYRLATLKDKLIKEGERWKLSLAADDIAAEVEANQPNPKPPEPIETDTAGEKAKTSLQMYFAMHRTLQSLARQFAGGKDGGVFWRLVVRPLNEAFSRLSTLRKEMGDDVAKLFSVYTKAEQERFYRDRQHFASIGRSLTTQGRLAIALNWGNEKNRRRVMDAYGWTEAQVQEVLDSLSKRDWDFVQSTWDYLDKWFPEANRVHQAVHGVPMTKEQPMAVATRFGPYAGGYYPIKFDPRISSKAGQRAIEAEAKKQTGKVGARTQEGFTKKRVEGKVTMPLRLSALDVIVQHLDEVAKSIATEETLFDVGRILKQKQVEDAIVGRHGRQIYNTIINQVVTAKFGMEGTSGLLAHFRNGATVVGLSWKAATAALQILGASNSIVRVGGPWVAMGYARMGKDAASLQSSADWIMERSEFMRHRRQNQSPEMSSLLESMKTKWTPDFISRVVPRELRSAHNWMVRNGFALMSNVQFYSVDMPTWYGAYFKAQSAGASEADAIAMADQAVIDAQGGGELHQLAAMQSGAGTKYGALLRILTNFMSYMVTTYNLGVQKVRNARTTAQIAALGLDLIMLAAVPVAGKMALDLLTKGAGEDDEPEEWLERYLREQAAFLFGPFVGVSQFAGSTRGDDAYGYKGPAGLAIFSEMNAMGAAVAEADFDASFWRPANRALGMALHYPASQVDATVRGAAAYFNGETDNPAAFFFGPPPAN